MERQRLTELKSKHFACVYKLEFPGGKVYVGKSKDIGKRVEMYERKVSGSWADSSTGTALYGAIRLYGLESVLCEVLFKVNGVVGVDSEKDLDYALGIVEMRWIKELRSNEIEYGYNSTEGGEMFGVRNMERVKEVEVEKRRVVYKDIEVPRERVSRGVAVVGYDINGSYLGEWPSLRAFYMSVLGTDRKIDFGVWKDGFIAYEKGDYVEERVESYAAYLDRRHVTQEAVSEAKRSVVGKLMEEKRESTLRRIVMCGGDYKEIMRFDDIKDAAEQTGISYPSIYAVLRKGRGKAHGFHFYWADEWDENGCKPPTVVYETSKTAVKRALKSRLGRVVQLDRKFEVVAVYDDIHAAAAATGLTYSNIYSAAKKGGNVFSGLYHWRFEDDIEANEQDAKGGSTDNLTDVSW